MTEKPSSNRISHRDFMKSTTAAIGGFIGLATSIPLISYILPPALQKRRYQLGEFTTKIEKGSLFIQLPPNKRES
ncbi:MAG: hypothetical protein KG029_14215 [Bacteroidetes bacterium]|nr:hypothetical protein [Bacteroidota bacterium]